MTTKSKVPQIRFKGFSGEWETKELGEIGSVAMNKRIFKNQTTEKGDIPFYKIGTFGGNADAFISRQLFEDYKSKYPYPKKGDLLISASGSIGRIVEYTGKDEYFQDSNIVWLKHENQLENSFLKQFYKVVKWNGLEGSTIQRLYNKNILETQISFPKERTEQTKIGDYFQQLDKLIEQKEKKYQKLKQFKKAMLDKMFPKNGADTPEIRFKGFSGKWEEKKLGDIGNTYTGLSGKTKEDFGHGEGRFVTYMNVFSNPISKQNLIEPIEIDEKQNEVQFGDVFFTTSSETPEEVGMTSVWMNKEKNIYLNSFCFAYRPEKVFDNYYLAYMLRSSSIRKKIVFLAQGISRYNISKNKVMEIYVPIPHIEEQKKIGNYFQKLDFQIDLQQKELEKLKNIKKASLAKMFV